MRVIAVTPQRILGCVNDDVNGSMKESNNTNDLRGLVVHVYTKGT